MNNKITSRQQQILQFIVQHIEMRGYPPTVQEIGRTVNLSSTSTVHNHFDPLIPIFLIKWNPVIHEVFQPILVAIE